MAVKKKKKSLKEKLEAKKKQLAQRGGGKSMVEYLKDEGTYRVRLLPILNDDAEFIGEIKSFYLGNDIRTVYSPDTIGEPCALTEAYNELKKSDDEDDAEMAKKMSPRNSYLAPVIFYKDLKGKKVDEERSGKLLKISKGVYSQLIDLYLDDDEWGDLTDPKDGYDIKITRTGKGLMDTEYDAKPCKNSPLPKKWKTPVDLDQMIKDLIPSYDETVEKRDEFLGLDSDHDEDDEPKKKSKKSKKKVLSKKTKKKVSSKKKKKKSDI